MSLEEWVAGGGTARDWYTGGNGGSTPPPPQPDDPTAMDRYWREATGRN